jgi:hypothetical protein
VSNSFRQESPDSRRLDHRRGLDRREHANGCTRPRSYRPGAGAGEGEESSSGGVVGTNRPGRGILTGSLGPSFCMLCLEADYNTEEQVV